MPAVEEIVTTRPDALAAHHRKGRAGDVDRTEQGGLDLRPELLWGELLEEPGVEVARVVDQHIDPAEPVHARLDGRLGARGVGDVKSYHDEVGVCSEHEGDLLGVTAGGNDCVTGGQGGLGDVDAHAAAGAGDEPNLLLTHAGALLLPDPQVVLGTASSVVHCYRTTRRPPVGAPDDGATDRDPLPPADPS